MRLNKFLAHQTGVSRREADDLIAKGKVKVNGNIVALGAQIDDDALVTLDGKEVSRKVKHQTIMLNKPVGYVCSRRAQGSDHTVYELLPSELHSLKTIGRLDRDSSGLILMTTDGDLAFQLTHPKFAKTKIYEVKLNKPLEPLHQQMIADFGVNLNDGNSQFGLEQLDDQRTFWRVIMQEGRNRQIRRTFDSLGYTVVELHRTHFGQYDLGNLKSGHWRNV